jgi:hypothetical protein
MGVIVGHCLTFPTNRADQFRCPGQRVRDGPIFAQIAMQKVKPLIATRRAVTL